MTSPLQVSVYTTLLGTDEGINPVALPELFSSGGSQNVYIDELGRARKILGYTQQNSTAVTTNGPGDPTANLGFHSHFNGTSEILFGVWTDGINEIEIWGSTDQGVTWTFHTEVGSHVAFHPVQYGDTSYIANPGGNKKYVSGVGMSSISPTQSPTPTAADSTNGTQLNGTYRYKLVSVESNQTRHAGSAASTAVQVQNEAVSLTWTADSDTNVTGYELYRTTGTGNIFYFVTFIEGRTTAAFTDNIPDRAILENRALQNHGDAPPVSSYVALHKDRAWWFDGTRGYFSDVGLPESVGTNNYLDFAEPDGRYAILRGGIGGYEGRLIVGTTAGIWTVSGTGAVVGGIVDFRKQRTNAQAGWTSIKSVVRVPEGAIFRDEGGKLHKTEKVTLAYMTPVGDIRIFDGDNDTIISSPVKATLSTITSAATPAFQQFWAAAHDELRGHIIWGFHTASEAMNTFVVWNYKYGVWYVWSLGALNFGGLHVMAQGTPGQTILLGGYSNNGRCFKFWNGNNFNGSNIAAVWLSGTIYGRLGEDTEGRELSLPALPFTKRWRWVDLILETNTAQTLTVGWYNGHDEDGPSVGSKNVTPNDSGLASSQRRVQLKTTSTGDFLHDEGMRLSVEDNSSNGQWSVEGFSLGFQVLPGLKRRSQ